MKRVTPILIFLLMFAGCAHRPLPGPYSSLAASEALPILRQRTEAIQTISAQGLIALRRPSGDSIRLDAALVARMPTELHLRAWKFNRTVFDLTLTPAGLWMLAPDDPGIRRQMQSGKSGTIQFARAWTLLTHDLFFSPALTTRIKGDDLLITRQDASSRIVCLVDRSTLTPRQYTLYDSQDRRQLVMRLDDYANHDGFLYPSRMTAESRFGQVDVRLRQIHINRPLSLAAFIPSPRAEFVP